MHVRRLAIIGVSALVGGAALAGCSSSTSSESSSAAADASAAAPASELASAEAVSEDCKIALLLPENSTPRYESADKPYFEEQVAATAPECEVLYFNAGNDGSTQKQQAETAITQGAQVLVLGSADSVSAGAIVQEAADKGIPTISYDRFAAGPVAFLVTFDSLKVGQQQGQALVDAMKAEGAPEGSQIVMINGDTSGFEAKLFKQGAHEAIDASGYEVGAEFDTAGWSPDTAATEMTQAITKLGKDNVKGVYVANDTMAGAAINALLQAGVTDLPPVTGQDAALDGLQRVLLGDQTMTVYKALKLEAVAAANAAVALAKGEEIPTTTGTLKNSTGNDVPVQLLDPTSVTSENMKDTVVADGFVKVSDLCTGDVKAVCDKLGIS